MQPSDSAPFPSATFTVPSREGDAMPAIRRALDDCFRAGGGTVVVEPGIHRVGGLRVHSNTTLLLRSSAVLMASRDPADYDILAPSFTPLPHRHPRARLEEAHEVPERLDADEGRNFGHRCPRSGKQLLGLSQPRLGAFIIRGGGCGGGRTTPIAGEALKAKDRKACRRRRSRLRFRTGVRLPEASSMTRRRSTLPVANGPP